MARSKTIGYIINEGISTESNAKILSDNGRRVLAEGTLQSLGVENRNRRIYLKEDIAPEVNGPRMKELLETGNMCGEEGHPVGPDASSITRQQTIDPKLISVRFTKIWIDGNLIKGQFMGTNTAYGETFNQDLLDGFLPSFSLRALGSIETKGGKSYVKNIKIVTWDRVIYPSHKEAYTKGLVTESAIITPSDLEKRRAYSTNEAGTLIPITNESVMSYIVEESANIKSIMDSFDTLYESMQLIENGTKVQLVDHSGDILVVSLETKIQNDIYSYCSSI